MRETHPTLYLTYMAYAVLSIWLGWNFLYLNPTFDPLDIPKWSIGAVFLGLGLSQAVLMNIFPNGRAKGVARLLMALTIAVIIFWTGALTTDFFKYHQTSLQLPITYAALAVIGLALLLEPSVNPLTSKNNGVNGRVE